MAKSEKKTGLHYVLKMPQLKVITKNGTFFTEKQSQGLFSDASFSLRLCYKKWSQKSVDIGIASFKVNTEWIQANLTRFHAKFWRVILAITFNCDIFQNGVSLAVKGKTCISTLQDF